MTGNCYQLNLVHEQMGHPVRRLEKDAGLSLLFHDQETQSAGSLLLSG